MCTIVQLKIDAFVEMFNEDFGQCHVYNYYGNILNRNRNSLLFCLGGAQSLYYSSDL